MTKNQSSDKFLNAINSFKKTYVFPWLCSLLGASFAEFNQRDIVNDSPITIFIYPTWFGDSINQNNVELPSFDPDCLFVQCLFKELRNEYKTILDDTGEPDMSPDGYLPFFVNEKTNIVMTWEEYRPILMNLWSMKRARFIDSYVIGQELSWKTMLETELEPAIIYVYWCSDNIYNSTLMKSIYVNTVPSSILKTIVLWYRKKFILKRYRKKNSFIQDQQQASIFYCK